MLLEGTKYVVTGGAGFIGSHLTEKLLSAGAEVVVVDDFSTGKRDNLKNCLDKPNFTLVEADLSDWSQLSRTFNYFRGADGVFHVAARARIQPSIQNPLRTHNANVTGTFNLLEMMRMMGIKRVVYSASSSSYGLKATLPCTEDQGVDCLNPYALTKYVGEQYCKTWGQIYGIQNVCLKYFNVYGERSPLAGPYAPVVGLFFRQGIKDGHLTVVGDGEQKRDFTHVDDVVNANILAMRNIILEGVSGETFNIGTGTNYTINKVASMVAEALVGSGVPTKTTYVPPRPAEARATLADISKAKKFLGWEPTVSLPNAISKLVFHYKHVIK